MPESFSVTGSPLKQTDSSLEAPPNALQKADFDCQSLVSSLALVLAGGPPCNEGLKGEFKIDTFWHVSHTVEQKSVTAALDWDEFDETVELQRTGTGRITGSTVNSSPENGSHLAQSTDFKREAQPELEMFMVWNCF